MALTLPLLAMPVTALLGACSSVSGAASGTQCFSAVDCAAGLVCIPKGSIRVCSNDIAGIETEIDAGGDGALLQPATDASSFPPAIGDATSAPGADAGSSPADATATGTGTPDATVQDTGAGTTATDANAD